MLAIISDFLHSDAFALRLQILRYMIDSNVHVHVIRAIGLVLLSVTSVYILLKYFQLLRTWRTKLLRIWRAEEDPKDALSSYPAPDVAFDSSCSRSRADSDEPLSVTVEKQQPVRPRALSTGAKQVSLRRIESAPAFEAKAEALQTSKPDEALGNTIKILKMLRHSIQGIDLQAALALFPRVQRMENLAAGTVLFTDEDEADSLYIPIEGSLGLFKQPPTACAAALSPCQWLHNDQLRLSTVGKGQVIGDFALAALAGASTPPGGKLKRGVTCVALVEGTRLLRMDASLIVWFCNQHPASVVSFIVSTLGKNWRTALHALVDVLCMAPAWSAALDPTQPSLKWDALSSTDSAGCSSDIGGHIAIDFAALRRSASVVVTKLPGEVITQAGSHAHSMYVLLSGLAHCDTVSRFETSQTLSRTFAPGCVIGGSSCFADTEYLETVVVASPVQLAVFSRSQFTDLSSSSHSADTSTQYEHASTLLLVARAVSFAQASLCQLFSSYGLQRVWKLSGEDLYKEGDPANGLYIVTSGRLRIAHHSGVASGSSSQKTTPAITHVGRGETVGELALIVGHETWIGDATAMRDTELVHMSATAFETAVRDHPDVLRQVARMLAKRTERLLSQNVPRHPPSRAALLSQGALSVSASLPVTPLAANFRSSLSQSVTPDAEEEENPRFVTISIVPSGASPPSIGSFSAQLCDALARTTGQPVLHLTSEEVNRQLGRDTAESLDQSFVRAKVGAWLSSLEERYRYVVYQADVDPARALATSTLLAATSASSTPSHSIRRKLGHLLKAGAGVDMEPLLRRALAHLPAELGLSSHMKSVDDAMASMHQGDAHLPGGGGSSEDPSSWTKLCIQQSDLCLLVGQAHTPAALSVSERQCVYRVQTVEGSASGAIATRIVPQTFCQRELVLLHPDSTIEPRNTRAWLRNRHVASHHHVRTEMPDDVDRVARFIAGRANGWVLGGGGARGLAHLGVFQAAEEAGVPIDFIGGTSQGAFMGAAFASTLSAKQTEPLVRDLADTFSSKWRMLQALTLPIHSWFSGHVFNFAIQKAFKDRQIEDLWIRTFCVTTDITSASIRVHTAGSLWRYCRASMTILGYMPPLRDPLDGHLLLDGGYTSNLPVEVLRALAPGVGLFWGVDVENKENAAAGIPEYGDSLSGWFLLVRWLLSSVGLAEPLKIPSNAELGLRVSYITHSMLIAELLSRGDDSLKYIQPKVGSRFSMLAYDRCDEIAAEGYRAARDVFDQR